jgi:hypothetical protein
MDTQYAAHDGITLWGFGTTIAAATADAKNWTEGRFDAAHSDWSVDPCGDSLWAKREEITDPSSGWSVNDDGVVELDEESE